MIDRNLSFSQIKFWLHCRRQWSYKFRDGWKPTTPPYDFMRGSLLHFGMEFAISRGREFDWWEYAVEAWQQDWKINIDEWHGIETFIAGCKTIVEGAYEVFDREWDVLLDDQGYILERRFYCNDLPGWRGLVFIPDVVAVAKTGPYAGGVFGVDFKSYGKPKEELAGELDLQGAIYQHGLRGKGFNAIGSVLFQLASTPPKVARVNKDGSTNKTDERSILSWRPVNGSLTTYRSEEFLEGIWQQIVLPTAAEIAANGGDDAKLIPHLDYYGCKFCEFRGPCLARIKGHDEAAILADQYTNRRR